MLGKVPAYLETSVDVPPMSKPITGKSSSLEYEVIAYPTTPPAGPRVWVLGNVDSVKKANVWNKLFVILT